MKICTALVAALILFGLLLPEANAAHPTQLCLDVEPDRAYPLYNDGDAETLEAAVGSTDAGHPPEREGCVIGEGGGHTNVDFEVTGASDPDSSNTPETPDLTCTTREGTAFCEVIPPAAGGGGQTIAAWIDFDNDDSTVELDQGEGYDEASAPGDLAEPDTTDVALWSWTHGDPPSPCNGDPYPGRQRCAAESLTIRYEYDSDRFTGSIAMRRRRCQRWRKIRVIQTHRDGSRRVVGRTKTNDTGVWRLRSPDARGRYYAVARRKTIQYWMGPVVCHRKKSVTIRVR